MNEIDRAPVFTFTSRTLGEEFLKRLRDAAYKYDVVTLNDIFRDRKQQLIPDGHNYGYHRVEIRKLKTVKKGEIWQVEFPAPSRMVRDIHGYWTTENVKALEKLNKEE